MELPLRDLPHRLGSSQWGRRPWITRDPSHPDQAPAAAAPNPRSVWEGICFGETPELPPKLVDFFLSPIRVVGYGLRAGPIRRPPLMGARHLSALPLSTLLLSLQEADSRPLLSRRTREPGWCTALTDRGVRGAPVRWWRSAASRRRRASVSHVVPCLGFFFAPPKHLEMLTLS